MIQVVWEFERAYGPGGDWEVGIFSL